MIKEINISVSPEDFHNKQKIDEIISKILNCRKSQISFIRTIKQSIDARQKNIKILLKLAVVIDEHNYCPDKIIFEPKNVTNCKEVAIIGAGPAGLFAALRLIELELKPIIFERGVNVHQRKKDIATMYKTNTLNINSNYCFGEGGAGTFSDGKLYTRSSKRGNVNRVLELFCIHGADNKILYEAHPHIGSDKLPKIIENIRNKIIECGGSIYFESKITDFIINNNKIKGIEINKKNILNFDNVIVAAGHSARDIYKILDKNKVKLEAKNFALGVRIEHPQEFVNNVQYHYFKKVNLLPPATYSFVHQVNGNGVFSFCMCPGGVIVPASTEQNQTVVNGMSSSNRNSKFANSGFVTEIKIENLNDYKKYGVFAGLMFQNEIETLAFKNCNGGLSAPAQRIDDFINKKDSLNLPASSYIAELCKSELHKWLPNFIVDNLSKAFLMQEKQTKGFITNNSIIVGVESRTSSPIRIPRNFDTFEHIEINGLYPCGEGAGYAGGIVSSAIDGINVAEKIFSKNMN